MPGVTAVLTADDLEFAAGVPCASNPTGDMVQPVRRPLAKGRVRHVGEPMAVVRRRRPLRGPRRRRRGRRRLRQLPAVIVVDAALAEGAPKVHEELESNVALVLTHKTDGVDDGVREGRVVVCRPRSATSV